MEKVTLLSVDSVYIDRTIVALQKCMSHFDFANVILMTHDQRVMPAGITRISIPNIQSIEAYSEFMIWSLPLYRNHFDAHCLCVQHDGYIMNPKAWEPGFLDYDYIGAPWPDGRVGNGGFSLRSQRLFMALHARREMINNPHPEDWRIAICNRESLETFGVKYAPTDVARRFAVENEPYTNSFGFHGDYTMSTLRNLDGA